jgi:hypothetical protein
MKFKLARRLLGRTSLAALGLAFATATAALAAGPSALVSTLSLRTSQPSLLALTAAAPGTYNSAVLAQTGTSVICVYDQLSHTGSPSVTWRVQYRDPSTANLASASQVWTDLLVSAAIAATDGVSTLSVGKGVTTASNVGLAGTLPAGLRVEAIITGAGSTTTATVGCDGSN